MQMWLYKVKSYKEKKTVELQNPKAERISTYVLVVTKRIIAVIALYLQPLFQVS